MMNDISFFDSDDVPQPRDQVKIEKLTAMPYPDGWRVRIGVDVTPFQERPSLEITIDTADGRPMAQIQLSVIETMHRSMEFTIHIRGLMSPMGHYVVRADLYYDAPTAPQDHAETPFTIPGG
ncbi:MAG: hypothetical protein ACYDBJ_05475 [Aggregatilineales bacterium]